MISVLMSARCDTHQSLEYFRQSVDSIVAQTHQDWELLIVNDHSLMPLEAEDERITIVDNPGPQGISRCLNFAISQARGEMFCRQDADDISHHRRLELLSEPIREGRHFVTSRYQRINAAGGEVDDDWMQMANSATADEIQRGIREQNMLVGGAPMWSRTIMHLVGRFDERLTVAQDYNYWIRILNHTPIHIVEEVLYSHRRHPDSHRRLHAGDWAGLARTYAR